ncbi:glycosyltransferase [Sulfitobacter sabulilitoris]|uniref:Glycosyltransferase n=1 Tax=Sulfitobacter sabulilitoris TaxID=2562655 RepID=A0A5S3P7I7_9RHOB|nr:glycosyltransferase [Sulfitobacter sabulilitoris]TMM49321.1 glycosyltransferase [Sulfitobacter sabulilitoris]
MTDIAASIILPAHNEAGYIDACLRALLASDPVAQGVEVIVVANGCTDGTAARALAQSETAQARGWPFRVLDLVDGGKLAALNAGDAVAQGGTRIYLDADVTVDRALIGALIKSLDLPMPKFAGGTPEISPAHSRITARYGRFWQRLPFVTQGVPGFGIFAVNASGRARWGAFPDIISDDTFVRLHFAPDERIRVAARYRWPMVEGFGNLVRVRRRQDAGVQEIRKMYPHLVANDDTLPDRRARVIRAGLSDPLGFGIYAAVALVVRALPKGSAVRWARGR